MAERHYALVLSSDNYNRKSRMAVVCAITSRIYDWPFEVMVPPELLPDKKGQRVASVILADAVRQIDYREREMEFVAVAPRAVVEQVLDRLLAVLEDD